MPRKSLTARTLENVFDLYKAQFNLGDEYQIKKADLRCGNLFGVIKIIYLGGIEVVHRYVKPIELINRLTESMLLGNPLF